MYGANRLKIGVFGSNCSSGIAATKVPERWSGSWEDNVRLARMLDESGIDFFLPVGRWRSFGGETEFEAATFETVRSTRQSSLSPPTTPDAGASA